MLPTPFISQFSASDIVESYLMAGGIGYVWIMRVFFLISVLAPFVAFVSKKVKSHYIFFSLIAVVLASITVLSILYADGLSENHSLLNVVLQTVCYVAVFSVGYRVVSVGRLGGLGGKVSIVAMAFLATIAVSLLSVGIEFQDYKFPPTGYFVVYGILGTLVIWQALAGLNRHRQPGRVDNLLSLVGSSTVWIYLWHIPVVLLQRATDLFPNFLVTWLAAMAFAMFAAFTQKAVITWLIERIRPRQDMKRLILGMFTG